MFEKLTNAINGLRAITRFEMVPFLLCQRLLGRRLGWTIYKKGRLKFLVDHLADDQNGTRDCVISPMYRELFGKMQLPRQLRLLDLGANGGGFPLLCLDLGFELASLTCVEANPFTHARLSLNIRQNVGLRAKVMNVAVGGHSRDLELSFPAGGTAFSIYGAADRAEEEKACIQVLTLDEIMRLGFDDQSVDLCKMDVEGAEYETLLEGPADSLRRIHHLIIEIHPSEPGRQDALRRKLESHGFEHVRASSSCGDVHLFSNALWQDSSRG